MIFLRGAPEPERLGPDGRPASLGAGEPASSRDIVIANVEAVLVCREALLVAMLKSLVV